MRPSWDSYFASFVRLAAMRATCIRRQHGAIIVRKNHILCTGYNGAPSGVEHCCDLGTCYRQEMGIPSGEQYEKCRANHAEQNAILQAAKLGIPLEGATMFISDAPCELCAKLIHGAGIKEVVLTAYSSSYDMSALRDFTNAGNTVRILDKEIANGIFL